MPLPSALPKCLFPNVRLLENKDLVSTEETEEEGLCQEPFTFPSLTS